MIFPGKQPPYTGFSIAMFDYQRVSPVISGRNLKRYVSLRWFLVGSQQTCAKQKIDLYKLRPPSDTLVYNPINYRCISHKPYKYGNSQL